MAHAAEQSTFAPMNPWLAPADRPPWIGLDVGGANLKIADGHGNAASEPFELWRRPDELPTALQNLLKRFDAQERCGLAVTMTGELADCFPNKATGVRRIVDACVAAAGARRVIVAAVDDRWLTPVAACEQPALVAAGNWRVAARLIAKADPSAELWIDVGSTTTDVIRLAAGRVVARGATDVARLQFGELVYTGVRRTPVCAVMHKLPYRGADCPIAAEWFATTLDAWLLLDATPEDATRTDTADGRPATRAHAIDRLARCVCCDAESFDLQDAFAVAHAIADEQVRQVTTAIHAVSRSLTRALVSGEGAFLARRAVANAAPDCRVLSVADATGGAASASLPAHAAAVLAGVEEFEP